MSTSTATTTSPLPPPLGTVVIATDLPLQGSTAELSAEVNQAVRLTIEKAGGRAGNYAVDVREYDDSIAATGSWDDATCIDNAKAHVAAADEVAVMGTYNSGCTKFQLPILNRAPGGPLLMVSHGNTNPGVTKPWDPGEPDRYYPTGKRSYARVTTPDDYQGIAVAQFAARELKVHRCAVLTDGMTYGVGIARRFVETARAEGIETIEAGWDGRQASYADLFGRLNVQAPDCVFLGGINDNNGEQLIRDKVAVLGPNSDVKLLATDGFSGYPTVQQLPEAERMFISFSGLPLTELERRGAGARRFVNDFRLRYGHEPFSAYALYAAAATQVILAAISASDGTREGVRAAVLSNTISIPAEQSPLGAAFSIDPATGDVSLHDISIEILTGGDERFRDSVTIP